MIDTIQIRIEGSRFSTGAHAPFTPVFSRRKFENLSETERARLNPRVPYVRKFVLHPERDDQSRNAIRVEIFEKLNRERQTVEYEMVINTSVTKLAYGNNLQELAPSDAPRIFEEMRRRLSDYGIMVTASAISTAPLSVCHFAKNIILPPHIKLQAILKTLSKTDMGKAYDVSDDNRITERNNGRSLRLASGVREWSFYDKINEMQCRTKRGAAGRQTTYEKEMVEIYGLAGLEVFRCEYRLNKSQTIKSELNPLLGRKYDTPVTLDCIFSQALWSAVLNNGWRKLINRPDNQMALLSADSRLDLWHHILQTAQQRDKGGHSQNQALWCYGLATAIRDHGVKTVRHEFTRIWSVKAGERLEDKMGIAAELIKGVPFTDGIAFVTKEIERFERLSLDSFKNAIQSGR